MSRGYWTMDNEIETQTSSLVAAGRARGGRATQQDDLICLHDPEHDARLLVVADGMGGDGAGELASAGVIEVTRRLWEQGHWRDQPGALFLETLCQDAHAELRQRGRGLTHGEPHSTVVALLTRGNRAYWAHVGDSRLYRFQGRHCLDCTEDHSVTQLKVRRGELAANQRGNDSEQHKLLRGLGGAQPPQVDHGGALLRPGQTFALCSDGVWENLSTRELGEFARRRDQPEALREALTQVLERGGVDCDNVALILTRVGWKEWLARYTRRPGSRRTSRAAGPG
ncbi:serine/threonine-protein phosphatase [Rhodanobacter sp. AS-Z3]|uniref:PP2C family protein-serine/threonine phosphatase n=1 Tax=Rhodanobacter sp. AS-Z3 TaxID=3031330 RepID=UPI00247A6CC3|nr:PP2C family serine/threonine-protein phosphatase [Rhodanobacter sp. AS-Z3]WEN14711.1 serine/threonine-protein phosphatase [Rhodanobacter sp. AS-Z3]